MGNITDSWEFAKAKYTEYLRFERNLSPNTVEAYGMDMELFSAFVIENHDLPPEQVTEEVISHFMAHLYDRNMQPATQARILSGIKGFYQFLLIEEKITSLPTEFLEAPRGGRKLPDVLSVYEIDAILDSIDLSHPQGHRNKAMLETLYSCGLRVSELVSLRLGDIFFDDGFLRVTGKGNKQRLVPLSSQAIKMIVLYLEQRRTMTPDPKSVDIIFLNRRGKKLTRAMIFTIIREAAARAGINKTVSPHTFRHSFATHLLEGGASIRQVQELLGHESILTTEIYTHLDRSHLRKSIEQHHPLSGNK